MDPIVAANIERCEELIAESQAIMAKADAEKRDLADDELKSINAATAEVERLKAVNATRQAVAAQATSLFASAGRRTEPEPQPVQEQAEAEAPRRPAAASAPFAAAPRRPALVPASPMAAGEHARNGFRHFGEFARAVFAASHRGNEPDIRLQNAAASTFGTEAIGADGGFLIPPEFRTQIMSKVFGEESLLARTNQVQVNGNSIVIPTDMTTPFQSTGGVQSFWEGEAAAITQSKPVLQNVNVRAHKLAALVPMTEELLEDAVAMGSYVSAKVTDNMDFRISDAIAWGNGVGQPLGFMSSPALITQAKESGQAADTILPANVVRMYSRLPPQSRASAVWLVHPDAEPQLSLMVMGDTPIYIPPGGFSGSPYGILYGRPLIPHQICRTLGDVGDLLLVDLSKYMSIVKVGGMKQQVSIHLWFDQDITAFKFTFRIGGQPWWSTPTQARNGTHTMSPFVALEAR